MVKLMELFAGIGGFASGVQKVYPNREIVYANEWDKYAGENYEKLYSHAPDIRDITTVNEKELPETDILTLGTPCVSFSHAGYQLGFEDMRGTVFFDAMRIAKEKKPKVMVIENVEGLVNNDNGNSIKRILETLNDIGYVVDFELLDSKYFKVAQQRKRVYFVAIRKDLLKNYQKGFSKSPVAIINERKSQLGHIDSFVFDWDYGTATPQVVFEDIREHCVDEKYYYTRKDHLETFKDVILPDKNSCAVDTLTMVGNLNIKGNESIKRVYSNYSYLPTLTTMQGGHRHPKVAYVKNNETVVRKATPKECWLAQGFTEEQFEKVKETSDSQLYKQAGNAVTTNVVEAIFKKIKQLNVL